MSEPHPEPPVSRTAMPPMTKDELEERIKQRKREMREQACYRCDHSEAAPDTDCRCCRNAHTPDVDGEFKET